MGISKAMMERILLRAVEPDTVTRFVCTRYGNVLGSRGSVVPLFLERIRQGRPLPITDPTMTRFLLDLDEAVEMAFKAILQGAHGEIWVKKMPAATIDTLATAVSSADYPREVIGVRPGEKMHESLINEDEMWRTSEYPNVFLIRPREVATPPALDEYTSRNTERLDAEQVRRMLVQARLL
jgi:UDP-glucose 4-epimerase